MSEIKPYMYKPKMTTSSQVEEENVNENSIDRTGSLDWCFCGNCSLMKTRFECYCCHESEIIKNMLGNNECITEHVSFESVIINIDTLKTARYHMLLNEKYSHARQTLLKEESNRVWRHVAYTQFVYWVNSWMPLGKKKRKVIPACVVNKIRDEFPESDHNYVGFRSTEDNDPEYFD